MTQHDPLLQPLTIKGLVLKNRIMSTSHAISYGVEGMPQERYQTYHEEKAKGGLALTSFGGSSVVSSVIKRCHLFLNSVANPDSGPECSVPAIGWPGMK